ncbi:MAG: hypothetical protein EBY63_05345, partial [Flavobacteriia bacterium]|nr:hypothetical protein [Flavobacteriia bacterium]
APFPATGSPALSGAETLADTSFLTQTLYRGAFAGGNNWADDWTRISDAGLLGSPSIIAGGVEVSENISTDTIWTLANSPYILKDYIFVEDVCVAIKLLMGGPHW